MAVLVEFRAPKATPDQLYELERLTVARGEAAGAPPYPGLMFVAIVPDGEGARFISSWRREADYDAVAREMLGPDAAQVGIAFDDPVVTPVLSLAMPGAHG